HRHRSRGLRQAAGHRQLTAAVAHPNPNEDTEMALTQDNDTKRKDGQVNSDPVAAAVTIFVGALVCLDASGNATPGATATTLTARGVATEQVDNSAGIAGAKSVTTRRGVFRFQ